MESPIPGTMGAMESAAPSPTVSLSHIVATTSRTATARQPVVRASGVRSLGHQLERDRIEQRARRVRQVIHALRERADARDTGGEPPRPLRAAIEDFGRELAELERRLRHSA